MTTALAAEHFTLADIRTLILYAKALAVSEPDYYDDPVGWQAWHDLYNEALAYVEGLA